MSKKTLLFLALLLPLISFGGGYQVNLVGIRYIGMGHIGTSLAQDAGSIFFNPGNMVFVPTKFSFTGGVSGIISKTQFRYSSPSSIEARTDNPISPPFTLFGMGKIKDKWSLGLGIYTPFGSSVHWPDNWAGKYLIRKISLQTVLFQPTLSYKITDKISIGAGVVFAYGKVDLQRAVFATDTSGNTAALHLKGHTTNWGFNAGIAFHPTEDLSIGVSYRSKINMNVKGGDATFTVPSSLSTNIPPNNQFDATLPLPSNLNVGVSYKFSDKLLVGIDANFVQWKAYDSLIFDFKTNTSSLQDSRNPRLYKNTFIVRVGGQYSVTDKFWVRAGAYFDNSPVQSQYVAPETPDNDRIGLSAGLSFFPVEGLSIDASFLYINQRKREASYSPANFSGTYKTFGYVPGIGITYNF